MSVKNYISELLPKKGAFAVFIVCFVVAALFWLLKNLSATFGHTISVPIQLVNYPKDWIVYGPEKNEIDLNVRGRGFQLVQWNGFHSIPLEIDLSLAKFPKKQGEGAYLLSNQLLASLHDYLGNKLEWDGVLPDTLFFIVDKRSEKRVAVHFNGSMSPEQEGFVVSHSLSPQFVKISGPTSVLDHLTSISTIEAHFELLHNDLSTILTLTVPGCDSCVLTPNQVELKISLEKLGLEELPSEE
jgi:hypothetical protein